METNPEQAPVLRILFGGDVMLGRNVKERILRFGADYPLGPVAPLLRDADLAIVNLECAITATLDRWPGEAKAFYFGAPPQAIASLDGAGIDIVSLANNHALDFGVDGLLDTLAGLHRAGIRYTGAGRNLDEALSAAIIDCHGVRFGMAAYCDHQADFAATPATPGIAYLDFNDESAVLAAWRKALEQLRRAAVDWPILSLHWGPNLALRPSISLRRLAHAAIDMGWKILFGHSAHVFHGIELHRGYPILYAAGDLVDDYRVDPEFRNNHQLLIEMVLTRDTLHRILLHPVFIENCQVRRAEPMQAESILDWMASLCGELGTRVERNGNAAWIDAGAASRDI